MSLYASLSGQGVNLPSALQAWANGFCQQLDDTLLPADRSALDNPAFRAAALKVCACSQFVADNWLRHPSVLTDLVASGDLFSSEYRAAYANAMSGWSCETEPDMARHLRLLRRREMLRIAWRDLAGWADLDETLRDLTALAEVCIQTALGFLYRQACQRWGTPTLADGTPFNLVVLGMGKLGAWELNYSSDIDLIFTYAEDGLLTGKKDISYSEFFTRICRSLVKMLDETTVDGFVFRTDIRLRPFGDSGPLIMNFDGMEQYYLTQAREWERYAMIKARQVAGDIETGKLLADTIKPFVYRRYLDYGAFEELRALKFQITQELRRKDRMDNVKLGPGGIREVEFIGQAFQLIRGGHESALRQREIQAVLQTLGELGLMTHDDVATLQFAYRFLRRVENHIQQYQDKQTHDLPTDAQVRLILAYSLDFDDWDSFRRELDDIRARVHDIFEQVFSLNDQDRQRMAARMIWLGADDDQALDALATYGFSDPVACLAAMADFKASHAVKRMSAKGAGVLDRLMPLLLDSLADIEARDVTLKRLLTLFQAVAGRSVYLALLAENPGALAQLLKLASLSPWLCNYLAQSPILFDELLHPATLYEPLKKSELIADLQRELQGVDSQDSERLMVVLRQFKHQNVLRVAAADLMGVIPVMVVSDYLTWIAEAILHHVLQRAWHMLADKHGCPPGSHYDPPDGLAIIAFGKFGGIELGYGSDLDLVFVYDCADDNALTDGDKPINCGQFYLRLGQKIRHILDTKLLSGVLYDIDLRLRPNGDSGVLVTHIASYEQYLRESAWTWEHQALVRARFVAGDEALKQAFEAIRQRILALPRDVGVLRRDVRDMRQKMRDNQKTSGTQANNNASVFDLKQGKGGIADIEFIVQFGVLAEAQHNPALAQWTDNVRLLESLAAHGFMSSEDAAMLKQAYCRYRDVGHHRLLQGESSVTDAAEFADLRGGVEALWNQFIGAA